jgi:hypothetical protein
MTVHKYHTVRKVHKYHIGLTTASFHKKGDASASKIDLNPPLFVVPSHENEF